MTITIGTMAPTSIKSVKPALPSITLNAAGAIKTYLAAIIEISTFTPRGKPATCTVSLAGKLAEK